MKKSLFKPLALCFLILCLQAFGLAQNDTLKAEALYQEAKKLYYKGDYEQAEKVFLKTLKKQQQLYGAQHKLIAKTYFRLGKTYRRLKYYTKAFGTIRKGLAVMNDLKIDDDVLLANHYNELGHNYDELYDTQKALSYFQKALACYERYYGPGAREIGGEQMNMGITYVDMGRYRQAGEAFQKAYDIFVKTEKPNSVAFNRLYLNLANLHRKQEDFDKCIEFAKKALAIKLKNYEPSHPSVAKYYGLVGKGYEGKGDFEEALKYYTKSKELAEQASGKNYPDIGGRYGELANLHVQLKNYKKALRLYKKGRRIARKRLDDTHPRIMALSANIGRTYEQMENYDTALRFYQDDLQKQRNLGFMPEIYFASTQRRVARVYLKKEDLSQAFSTIQDALKRINPEGNTSQEGVSNQALLYTIEDRLELLRILETKIKIQEAIFKKSQQVEDLQQAFQTSELSIQLIESIRKGYQSDGARAFLNSRTSEVFEQAVEQAFELYQLTKDSKYLSKAFEISEKSKASILWQSLNERHAFENSNIPAPSMDSINMLYAKISNLEEELSREKDVKKKKRLQNESFDLKRHYEQKIAGLEKYNPHYYALKYAPNKINTEAVLDHLPNHQTTLLEYFQTEDHLFIFVLSKKGIRGFKQTLDFDLPDKVMSLRNEAIQNTVLDQSKVQEYMTGLHDLHDLLIAPIHSELEEIEKLIIIPHGALHYLSFETLAPKASNTTFRNLDYLLKRYDIQYTWSAALWSKDDRRSYHPTQQYAGFAPGFLDKKLLASTEFTLTSFRNEPTALPHSIVEVENAQAFFSGTSYTLDAATESQFLNTAPESRIIHLATHGQVNNRFPMESGLLFAQKGDSLEDGFLNATEIYNLKLSADLMVMSACNSGYGRLARGEGVMSLGRAFMYAGCKSVIMSLWPANDESSSFIIRNFYQYSADGLSKDRALKAAKLDYLQQADPLTAHPYFWANLVAVGDMSPLKQQTNNWLWYGLFLLLGLVVIFGFWKNSYS